MNPLPDSPNGCHNSLAPSAGRKTTMEIEDFKVRSLGKRNPDRKPMNGFDYSQERRNIPYQWLGDGSPEDARSPALWSRPR